MNPFEAALHNTELLGKPINYSALSSAIGLFTPSGKTICKPLFGGKYANRSFETVAQIYEAAGLDLQAEFNFIADILLDNYFENNRGKIYITEKDSNPDPIIRAIKSGWQYTQIIEALGWKSKTVAFYYPRGQRPSYRSLSQTWAKAGRNLDEEMAQMLTTLIKDNYFTK